MREHHTDLAGEDVGETSKTDLFEDSIARDLVRGLGYTSVHVPDSSHSTHDEVGHLVNETFGSTSEYNSPGTETDE